MNLERFLTFSINVTIKFYSNLVSNPKQILWTTGWEPLIFQSFMVHVYAIHYVDVYAPLKINDQVIWYNYW